MNIWLIYGLYSRGEISSFQHLLAQRIPGITETRPVSTVPQIGVGHAVNTVRPRKISTILSRISRDNMGIHGITNYNMTNGITNGITDGITNDNYL